MPQPSLLLGFFVFIVFQLQWWAQLIKMLALLTQQTCMLNVFLNSESYRACQVTWLKKIYHVLT